MNANPKNNNEIDPGLLKLIALLRPTPPRDPQTVERNRARFLAQVDTLIGTSDSSSQKKKFYQFHKKEKKPMNAYKPKFALTTLFVFAAIFVFLFGGTGITVYAAQSALPGDALYPVKTGLEQTRLSLTSADDQLAQMNLSLAQKRLTEIEGLIRERRFDQVAKTAAEFQRHIQQMAEAIKRLAESDPVRASELTSQLMTEVTKYTQALTEMLAQLPDEVKMEVEKAIIGSESASGMDDSASPIEFSGTVSVLTPASWTVAGRVVAITAQTEIKGTFAVGDVVKVHARAAADGSLTALEIEAAETTGNNNDNSNANENENANGNENENGNSNENANGNENENENENGNTNGNENENSNGSVSGGEFEFKGKVQTILPDLWVIGGVTVSVSAATEIRGTPKVGSLVEVRVVTNADGSLMATRIKLEDGSSSSKSGNDNSNDNGDDSGKSGSDDNSNDDSGKNGGSDDNSNDDSGKNGGSDDNSNDNGDDDD